MNAAVIRRLYDYHFYENRKLFHAFIMPLTDEQFTRPSNYSIGSVRDQFVHVTSVDDGWFSEMIGTDMPERLNPDDFNDREKLGAQREKVNAKMKGYLATLTDDMLMTRPLPEEDAVLVLWEALFHVVNHATDHRAQIYRLIHDMGVETPPQDYGFYVYDNPIPVTDEA